ncbi:cache domain-containing sensor histidine kinase [Paenibacillus sp. 1P07SE]|uniref:cache domain-containing sensor histidine kinase n=1 Tax=Paenibacillus sp. 1P07SE TaxID=3132209 RepID=UPI0039A665C1
MRAPSWLRDLSLKRKLIVLFAAIGIVPLVITFFISYNEIHKSLTEGQSYSANRNYEQTLTALSSTFSHIEEISSMIIVNKDIQTVLSRKPDEMRVPEQLAVFDNIYSYTRILESNTELDKIIYFVNDEFVVTGADALFRPYTAIADKSWAHHIHANRGKPTWVLYEETRWGGASSYLTLGRLLWNPNNYTESVGIVAISIDRGQLSRTMSKSVPEQVVYLETETREVVASSGDAELARMRLPERLDSGGRFVEVRLASGTYLAREQQLGTTGLYLVSVMSQRSAMEAVTHVRMQLIAIYAGICIALLALIVMIARSVTRRVFLLMNKMSQVRQGRLNLLDIEPREDEIGQLVSSYNYMIHSVQELMDEQFRLGQEKTGAELKALQSQINPHFLYNTLDMLNWMALRDERSNIQQVVYALSDYYKLILNKGEDFVTLRDELRLCSIYMEIQNKRFKNRIRLEIDVDENAMICMLPKITLQPLVENAIVHGILEKPEGSGVIAIRGGIYHGRLKLQVADDGVGFGSGGSGRPGAARKGSGYGLSNIGKRLELYYGESQSLRFESKAGQGASVLIDVPVVLDEREKRG